jgi:MarR-like DNA-binding transcriptional regulator SgrR of sgrS sRNA
MEGSIELLGELSEKITIIMQYFQKHGGIDKGKYWILDVAVQYSQYVSSLRHEEEYLEQAFNRKGHGLTYSTFNYREVL